jgi:hypothetical protein
MKRVLLGGCCLFLGGVFITGSPDSASARTKYLARFIARYGETVEAAGTQRCAICHGGPNGATKTILSSYAMGLRDQIGMKNCTDDALIDAALTAMEAVESEPDNPDGPTFGEILGEGNLPAPAPPPVEDE